MATMIQVKVLSTPGFVPTATRYLSLRALRDGAETSGVKVVRFFNNAFERTLMAIFELPDGIHSSVQRFAASAIDGEWLVIGEDPQAPRRARALYLTVSEDAEILMDITAGGSASSGSPAALDATVRVDRLHAAREVVALERPSSGQWRVAGYGRSNVESALVMDLRVADGLIYAIAIDDYGYAYQPSLAVDVGDTIRPIFYTGWLYRITEAGTLPATEPEWWPAEGDNASRLLGTARAIAVRYYQPLAHGPLPVELL